MYVDFEELLQLFNLSLKLLLLQEVFDTQWEAAVPGNTRLACFHSGCVRASVRCAARTARPDTALSQVWQPWQHCHSLRESGFSSLTTQTKEKPEERVTLPPHTASAVRSHGIAELWEVSVFFSLWT